MKNQFFSTFHSQDDTMSSSSQGSMGSNMFEGLAGESQPDDSPVLEDYWDALIQSVKGKAQQ
ncbi:hypothetical protein A2U01_0020460 [Trifolium medium]|uniref:Uncharacterized protein n=4 Tax=Trifolium medium TaxID=97028 RepID=A0A392NHU4_9FABA|nr:hypothetical protein [Trifolium medium]